MDGTHIHLLLNHVPTIGFVVAVGFYLVSLVSGSRDIKLASLALMVGVALATIPAYVTGNMASAHIQDVPDVEQSTIATHEGAAFLAMIVIQFTGAIAWLAVWALRRTGRVSTLTDVSVLVLAVVALALVAGAANLGGNIRHTEIRPEQEVTTAIGPLARTVGNYVRDTPWTWVTAETLHFVGLSLIVGVLTVILLRMVGVMAFLPTSVLTRLLPWGMLGYAINTMSGMLFFAAAPQQYVDNQAFYWKLVFLLLAASNVLYFTFDDGWQTQTGRPAPALTKALAASALFFWVGVMYWGSMLPFIGNAF
jgi:uncharacterized membrane protein